MIEGVVTRGRDVYKRQGREGVVIGDEEEAPCVVLHADEILQSTEIVAQMKPACGTYPAEYSIHEDVYKRQEIDRMPADGVPGVVVGAETGGKERRGIACQPVQLIDSRGGDFGRRHEPQAQGVPVEQVDGFPVAGRVERCV